MNLRPWFVASNRSFLAQIVVGFAMGIFLSPWDTGLFFLVVYRLVYELILYFYLYPEYWYGVERIVVFCASFLGYAIGRSLCGLIPLDPKVPGMI